MQPPRLAQALREQHEAAMIEQAETIRQWPVGRERHKQAMIHVRLALWERGLGRIRDEVQVRVYTILNFVMPDDAAHTDGPVPLEELAREAEWETTYHELLDRQSCPDCGDGICPVDE